MRVSLFAMINIFLLIFILLATTLKSQWLVEDFDVTENAAELGRVQIIAELNDPVEFYRLKCENPVYAQFSGGESALRDAVADMLHSFLSHDLYAVNGAFQLILTIGSDGQLQHMQLKPEIKNGEMLYRDLSLLFHRLKPNWLPATCDGNTVSSRIRMKINLRTEFFDS